MFWIGLKVSEIIRELLDSTGNYCAGFEQRVNSTFEVIRNARITLTSEEIQEKLVMTVLNF